MNIERRQPHECRGLLEKTFTVLNVVSRNVSRLVEIQEKSTVIVDPTLTNLPSIEGR
jgi:hypothetical protein